MKTILWEVDAQADFMLPRGKLYVPGAEKIIPNLDRLVDLVRQRRNLLISSADAHHPDDPEFRDWPPHCLKGTPGAELIPEARVARQLVIPNEKDFFLPRDLGAYDQIILEKNTLDVFDNSNTDALLARLAPATASQAGSGPGFLIFGVVTELCVRCAAMGLLRRGFRVSLITDAIRSLDEKKGSAILDELQKQGTRLSSTQEVLARIGRDAAAAGIGAG